jgi:hypothetical protein
MKFCHQYQTQGHSAVTSMSENDASLSAPRGKWTAAAVSKLEKDVNNLHMADGSGGPRLCSMLYHAMQGSPHQSWLL